MAKRPRSPGLPETEPLAPARRSLCDALCGSFFTSLFRSSEDTARLAADEALREAAATGDVEGLRRLLADGADVHARNEEGMTALHCAAVRSEPEAVRVLLEAGARAAAINAHGSTPLHNACARSTAEVARLLVEAGAPVNEANKQGFMPLDYAAQWNRADVAEYLLSLGAVANDPSSPSPSASAGPGAEEGASGVENV